MYLTVGVAIFSASVLLFAWGYDQHLRTSPARWTQSEFLSSCFALLVTSALPIGLGFIILGVVNPAETWATLSVPGVVVMVASVALAVVFSPRFIRKARMQPAPVVPFPSGRTPEAPKRKAA